MKVNFPNAPLCPLPKFPNRENMGVPSGHLCAASSARPETGGTPKRQTSRRHRPMKLLKNPYVQTTLVVLGVLLVLPFVRPLLAKIPFLNTL